MFEYGSGSECTKRHGRITQAYTKAGAAGDKPE